MDKLVSFTEEKKNPQILILCSQKKQKKPTLITPVYDMIMGI